MRQGNVFQSCLSVSHSINSKGGFSVTITHNALDLTVQGLPPNMGLQWAGPPAPYQVVTLGGQGWRPVQTCSLEDPATPSPVVPRNYVENAPPRQERQSSFSEDYCCNCHFRIKKVKKINLQYLMSRMQLNENLSSEELKKKTRKK